MFFMSNEIHSKYMCACNMQPYLMCELLKKKKLMTLTQKKKKTKRGDKAC